MKTRTELINFLVKKYKLKKYLEIGVRNLDANFNKIDCPEKIGVDPSPGALANYIMTSDQFFSQNKEKFDIIFIDGMHTEEQVFKDIKNSLDVLSDNGFVVAHDCNPIKEWHARSFEDYQRKGGVWNGTTYKGFIKARKTLGYKGGVVDIDHGCGVIRKNKQVPVSEYKDISWEEFDKNRVLLLNLMKPKFFARSFLA